MTNVLLIRHETHDLVDTKMLGHTSGIHLNDSGKRRAEQLAAQLSIFPIEAIYSSPLERARESAEPLGKKLRIELQLADEFNEVDVGDWSNRTFVDLDSLPEWQNWNNHRSGSIPPGGECMLDVQARVIKKLLRLQQQYRCIAIFTHGDVIRAALTHFLGMHLDLLLRFQVDPGSVSLVQMHKNSAVVRMLNWSPIANVVH